MPRRTPSVVLVGRPNVGKSTLFNRMTGSVAAQSSLRSRARPATRWRGRSCGAAHPFSCLILEDFSARARIRCTNWSSNKGSARSKALICWFFSSTGAKDWLPATSKSRNNCVRPASPCCWRSTRPTTNGRARAMDFYRLGFEPSVRNVGRAWRRRRRIAGRNFHANWRQH